MFRVSDLVKATKWSRRKAIRVIERTPGVILLFNHPETLTKRKHRTFIIPAEVFQRLIQQGKARADSNRPTVPQP